jgi:hypothetical protein
MRHCVSITARRGSFSPRSFDRYAFMMRSADDSFAHLLYLYLWPFWLFRDANRGNLVERAAAYRHNRAQRIHLPGYALKWTILMALQGACLFGVEQGQRTLDSLVLFVSAGLGTMVSVSAVVVVLCLAVWGYLTWVEG